MAHLSPKLGAVGEEAVGWVLQHLMPHCYGFSLVQSGPDQVIATSGLPPLLMPTHFIPLHMYHFHLDHLTAYRGRNSSFSRPFHPFLDGSAVERL
jgi:hypothetical protein